MPKDIYLEGEDIKFVDGVQTTPRKLDEIVKGSHSAHKTRHQDTGADEINVVGLSGLLADGQTPLSHKVSHQNGGTDEIDLVGLSGLLANDVELEEIGTATYDDIQNWINNIQSAGYVSGGTITATSPSDGTIAISAIKGFLKITDSDIGVTKSFDLAGTASFALTNNQSNYIYVDYNDGTPKFNVTTTRSDIELNRQFTLGRVYRKDNETHIVNSGAFLTNHVRNTHERLVAVRGFERATGGVTSETGERYLYVTAGTFYLGQNKATTSLVDTSGTETFTRYYHTASVWTSDVKSQIAEGGAGFYKYDNGTDLVNLSNNKYGVFWVFIHFDGDLHVIVGRGDYTLAEAQGANVPAIPNGVNDFATLIAKIILLEDGTNFTSVETAYEQFFPYSRAVNHNDLGIIQGGAADDYYHLTNAQLTGVVFTTGAQTIAGVKTFDDTPKTDAIAEKTAATGVTIDGVLIKDSLDVSGIVAKTGAQTVAGVKTLSDNLVFSGDKTIQTNVKARAYLGTNQENLVNDVWTKVLLDTENYDIGADFATATNRFVAPVTGYYLVTIAVGMFTIVADRRYDFAIYKNNVAVSVANVISATTDSVYMNLTDVLYLTATDYIEMFVKSNSGGNLVDIAASSPITFMAIHLLSV